MANELQVFKNSEFGEIRTVTEDDGKVLFCGKDIAAALGYSNTRDALNRHCKGVVKRDGVSVTTNQHGTSTSQTVEMSFIPEGDVYRLVCNSKLPSAEKFERWVFDEVLPSIRKHGGYLTPQKVEEVLLNPDTIIRLATDLKAEREKNNKLAVQNARQEQIINELKPKADYTDKILQNRGLVTITQIAKDYGMSGEAMNALLHELGIQYKQSDQWLLYAKYQSMGYTHSHTIDIVRSDGRPDVKMNTKWTQKGRLFLYNKLREHGCLPVIERPDPDEEVA